MARKISAKDGFVIRFPLFAPEVVITLPKILSKSLSHYQKKLDYAFIQKPVM